MQWGELFSGGACLFDKALFVSELIPSISSLIMQNGHGTILGGFKSRILDLLQSTLNFANLTWQLVEKKNHIGPSGSKLKPSCLLNSVQTEINNFRS